MTITFNGCVITKLERKLRKNKDSFTIFDPILNKMNISLTRENRSKITMSLFIISFVLSVYKLQKLSKKKNSWLKLFSNNEIRQTNRALVTYSL